MGKPSWGIMYPISRFYNGDSHCGESRCLATPQRWQFVRGHVKPMGLCTIYFPGGIKTLMKSKMRGLVGGQDRSRVIFPLLQTLLGKLGMMKHGKLTWQWNIAIFNRRYIHHWYIFQRLSFHCCVSLPEGNCEYWVIIWCLNSFVLQLKCSFFKDPKDSREIYVR